MGGGWERATGKETARGEARAAGRRRGGDGREAGGGGCGGGGGGWVWFSLIQEEQKNFQNTENVRSHASLRGQLRAVVRGGAAARAPGRRARRGVGGGRVVGAVRDAGAR